VGGGRGWGWLFHLSLYGGGLFWGGGGGGESSSVRLRIEKSRVRSPGSAKKWMHVLPLLRYVLCYIIRLIVVSDCRTVNLRHSISLAPLCGSVYITVLNCVYYVMFIWWFVFHYMYCPAWHMLGLLSDCPLQRSVCNCNKNIIILLLLV